MRNYPQNKYIDNEDGCKVENSSKKQEGIFHSNLSKGSIEDLFNEYKKQFEIRNISRVNKILIKIEGIQPNSPTIDLIKGEQFLYNGNQEKSYFHLSNYITKIKEIDPYALGVIATWNENQGFYNLAYSQFVKKLKYPQSKKSLCWTLFCAITNKKRCRFLNSAISFYERLLVIPEGYELLRFIKIELAHIYILKKNFEAATHIINQYTRFRKCIFIKRLKVYIDYIEKNYNEILKYKNDNPLDSYIAYVIGRIGLDNPKLQLDSSYYFEKAIKNGGHNPFVYNSYGNYYFKNCRFTEALEQYNNALFMDSTFHPACENMELITERGKSLIDKSDKMLKNDRNLTNSLSESDPDVEDMGFLNINILLGYSNFRKNIKSQKELYPLRLILHKL